MEVKKKKQDETPVRKFAALKKITKRKREKVTVTKKDCPPKSKNDCASGSGQTKASPEILPGLRRSNNSMANALDELDTSSEMPERSYGKDRARNLNTNEVADENPERIVFEDEKENLDLEEDITRTLRVLCHSEWEVSRNLLPLIKKRHEVFHDLVFTYWNNFMARNRKVFEHIFIRQEMLNVLPDFEKYLSDIKLEKPTSEPAVFKSTLQESNKDSACSSIEEKRRVPGPLVPWLTEVKIPPHFSSMIIAEENHFRSFFDYESSKWIKKELKSIEAIFLRKELASILAHFEKVSKQLDVEESIVRNSKQPASTVRSTDDDSETEDLLEIFRFGIEGFVRSISLTSEDEPMPTEKCNAWIRDVTRRFTEVPTELLEDEDFLKVFEDILTSASLINPPKIEDGNLLAERISWNTEFMLKADLIETWLRSQESILSSLMECPSSTLMDVEPDEKVSDA
ncbi:unnamed protein product [Notodromas monacha]|uniref:Uncharacterized protein n=1 Tax=Notodromas monacha TaxID=399045 RepID=A0A7R9BH47_9CRUS|nr:unnamed protein product [Notodromas monacha]CAG0913795.1 unnamed protein product [Notodromas monacha]